MIEVEVTLITDGNEVYKVESHLTGESAWILKSICKLRLRENSVTGILTLPENIASEKRLI